MFSLNDYRCRRTLPEASKYTEIVKILLESWEFFFKNAVQLVVLRW